MAKQTRRASKAESMVFERMALGYLYHSTSLKRDPATVMHLDNRLFLGKNQRKIGKKWTVHPFPWTIRRKTRSFFFSMTLAAFAVVRHRWKPASLIYRDYDAYQPLMEHVTMSINAHRNVPICHSLTHIHAYKTITASSIDL